jgi:hypothetical protein
MGRLVETQMPRSQLMENDCAILRGQHRYSQILEGIQTPPGPIKRARIRCYALSFKIGYAQRPRSSSASKKRVFSNSSMNPIGRIPASVSRGAK